MLISNTYLNQYRLTIQKISFEVNKYLLRNQIINDKKDRILASFYLRFLSDKSFYYSKIIMYKNNKKRVLYEPSLKLKYIQKYILHTILYKFRPAYKLDKCVTGFIAKKGILENAKPQ